MKRVALVDISYLFRKAWHGAEHSANVNTAFETVRDQVHRVVQEYDHAAICLDAPPYKRTEVYAEYKANREAPDQQMTGQFSRLKECLDADGLHVLKAKGYEADDVIATATRQLRAAGHSVHIVSPDKDLAQLVDDSGVSQVIPAVGDRESEVRNEGAVAKKFGVPPAKLLDLLALCGDKSDNVPGCPGIGAKTGVKLLEAYETAEGVINQMAAELKDEGEKASKMALRVCEHAENIRLSKQLIALATDAPIDALVVLERKEKKERKPMSMPESEGEFVEPEDAISAPPSAKPRSEPRQTAPEAPSAGAIVAVAPGLPVAFRDGLEPKGLQQAVSLAQYLDESRMFAKRFANRESILAVVIAGRELGMGALAALRNFHFFEGQLTMHAHLIAAQAKQHPECEYFQFVGGDATFAEYETKRRSNPRPTRLKYTIAEAEAAGLLKVKDGKQPGPWITRPAEMLRKTAAVQLSRIEYPEVTAGMYCPEEINGEEIAA